MLASAAAVYAGSDAIEEKLFPCVHFHVSKTNLTIRLGDFPSFFINLAFETVRINLVE